MPVGIIVQSDAGDVANANAYESVASLKAYHVLRGNDLSAFTDDQLAVGLIRTTDYIDNRWAGQFPGTPLVDGQTTAWPRADAVDRAGNDVIGIPAALKKAASEYALRAAAAPLQTDIVAPVGGHIIKSTKDKVDVLETEVVYDNIPGYKVIAEYPAADQYLRAAGLITATSGGIPLKR